MQISTVMFDDLNSEMRIDAEYYRAEVLNRIDILHKKNSSTLDKLVSFVVGPFGSTVTVDKYVDKSDFQYVRNKDINDFVINQNDAALIPEAVFSSLKQFHIKKNDILLTVVGTLGKAAIAQENNAKSIFSCKSTLLRTMNVNPYYLLAYLNSLTGQLFVLRGKRGAIQEGLNLFDLKEVEVYLPSDKFQNYIGNVVQSSFSCSEKSQNLYSIAQTLLLSELGLLDWKPKHNLSFVKNYSDTQQAGRFDAEYFQPKYDEIVDVLVNKRRAKPIGDCNIFDITTGQYSDEYVESNKGAPYIRGTDLTNGSVSIDNLLYLPTQSQIEAKKAKAGDVVVTRVGTIGLSARIPDECEGSTISDNLIRIRISDKEKINTYYLSVYLNSIVGRELMLRNGRGSVQQRLNQETLKEIVFPILPFDKQLSIAEKITESFNLRKQSKHLLECAKKAVEMAIEKDDETAMQWLKSQIDNTGRNN